MSRIHNRKYLGDFRKHLRNEMTIAEALLWRSLKQRQLDGRKFRRQHSVGNYILDFYCVSARLAIELDGGIHSEPGIADHYFCADSCVVFGILVGCESALPIK